MKAKELKTLRLQEPAKLGAEVHDLEKKIALAQMDIRAGKEKNLKKVRNLRRSLAQVLTVIQEKGTK